MTEEEKVRYSRHLLLEEVGEAGQEKLLQAKVLVVGAGGLGSPVLLYLAAAGIGTLGIMDDDTISESNLQRQVLYDSLCLGAPKAETARRKLQALNPHCNLPQSALHIPDHGVLLHHRLLPVRCYTYTELQPVPLFLPKTIHTLNQDDRYPMLGNLRQSNHKQARPPQDPWLSKSACLSLHVSMLLSRHHHNGQKN